MPPLLAVLDYDWYYHFQPPRYNWNIVESDVKHHKPNQCRTFYTFFLLYHVITNTIIFNAGLEKRLALCPELKHLFRLAQHISLDECYRVVKILRLSDITWSDIQNTNEYDIPIKKFCALHKWRDQVEKKMSKPTFQHLYDALAEMKKEHVLCQVGNNCSHRWLFNCIKGYICSHRWLFDCIVGNNCSHRWLLNCIVGND
jgi:hypothetical protein